MKVSMVLWLSAVVEDNHEVNNHICVAVRIGAASISERWRVAARGAVAKEGNARGDRG